MRKGLIFGSIIRLGNCWCTIIILTATSFISTLLAGQDCVSKPSPKLLNPHSEIQNPKFEKAEIMQRTQRLQMPFIANEGQTDEKVVFYANTFGGAVFVTKDAEIVYSLPQAPGKNDACRLKISDCRTKGTDGKHGRFNGADYKSQIENYVYPSLYKLPIIAGLTEYSASKNPQSEFNHQETEIPNFKSTVRGLSLKEEIVGGKINEIKGEVQSVTKVNYFKGNDSTQWKTNISTYEVVNLGEVYKGIDLKLKAYGDNVEKLFYVKPGADPEHIKIRLSGIQPPESPLEKGARVLWVNEHGQLVAETELGPVKFTKPIAYQKIDGKRVGVEAAYVIRDRETRPVKQTDTDNGHASRTYGFKVASYDKTKPLIIDPLLASTFLGGSGDDNGISIALDKSGNVYVTGQAASTDFPTTSGAYDTSYNGYNGWDVFVSKLNSGLTSLLASTYLGGSGEDYVHSLAIDTSGNVYVTGYTGSSDFPTTSGAYDTSHNGGGFYYNDVFVSKLDGGLTSLLASTFLGGSGYYGDHVYSLTIDASGNVYVTGETYSTDFPTTSGAYDTTHNGTYQVFVSKLDGNLSALTLPPTVTTGLAINITSSSAILIGIVNANELPTTALFQYGTTSGSYSNISSTQNVSGSSDTTVSIGISGLLAGATYYYRIAAQNSAGRTYGSENIFTTTTSPTPTPSPAITPTPTASPTPTVCEATDIEAFPKTLRLKRGESGDITVTVRRSEGCQVVSEAVTATIKSGKKRISVTPLSQATDDSGEAIFTITATKKTGNAKVTFEAAGVGTTVKVKVVK